MSDISIKTKNKKNGQFDVIVCGGGPAGVSAAISAARGGAEVLIIERNGCLGGIWTAGLLTWILDIKNKKDDGIMGEIISDLSKLGVGRYVRNGFTYTCDVEEMKHYLEQKCISEDISVRYHTMLADVVLDKTGNRIEEIVTVSKSGTELFNAKMFIDATGDGDLGALAGCEFEMGDAEGNVQPMSLIGLIDGIDAEVVEDVNNSIMKKGNNPKKNLLEEMKRAGITPTYLQPTLMQLSEDGVFALMSNHQYGVSAADAQGITDATIAARDELYNTVKALKKLGGAWRNIRLVTSAEQIGVREGRRIKGQYYITADDLASGRHFDDAVCDIGNKVDIHSLNKSDGGGISQTGIESQPYQIPLRALISKDRENLLMAGRCISGDFYAHSTYRLTGNAVMTGSAAGKTAAAAIKTGKRLENISCV